jgi:hypothetical protein
VASRIRYDWVRYWQRWNGQIPTPARDFLPEVSQYQWDDFAASLRTLEQLDDVPCLVLLGEPGIGKTHAVEDEVTRLKGLGRPRAHHDLKRLSDAARFEHKVFDAPKFQALAAGSRLTLFLDSLDEGRIVIQSVGEVLLDELRDRLRNPESRTRLKLRITCRSAEWPASLSNDLRDVFGEDNVQEWHLCPLRQSDVERAAEGNGLDASTFLRQIETRNAQALAAKPVTLTLLLNLAAQEGALPDRQADLYRKGLLELCAEPNDWRREEKKHGRLLAQQRLALAGRIAAFSLICQRPFIQQEERPGAEIGGVLTLAEICADRAQEECDDGQFSFTKEDVQEVLATGLFRGVGDDRVGWVHQTYAEFLAADYLVRRGFTATQLESLLQAPGEAEWRVAPQLRELSAWLASLSPDIGKLLLRDNPDSLLRSDIMVGDEATRLDLARAFLDALETRRIDEGKFSDFFPRLVGPGLGEYGATIWVRSARQSG